MQSTQTEIKSLSGTTSPREQSDVRTGLATAMAEAPQGAALAEAFDAVYRAAAEGTSQVPWFDNGPDPILVNWFNTVAPGRVRPGARVAVVGCGLGDDVIEAESRGYDAIGFDIAPTAIEMARRRFPAHSRSFVVADVLSPPARFLHRFDLVIEISTIQALHPSLRERAAAAIVNIAGPRGLVLAICRARDEDTLLESVAGPPWPLSRSELSALMESAGAHTVCEIAQSTDSGSPPNPRLCGLFSRCCDA